MTAHPVLWKSPSPFWGRFGKDDLARPAILRFASDEFMDQLLAILAAEPRQLGDVIARPETWRNPGTEAPDLAERVPLPRIARLLARMRKEATLPSSLEPTEHERTTTENDVTRTLPLKLYHPAHQRHYLVAANLVCGVAGLPDRGVGREQTGFVMRRLLPPKHATDRSVLEEYAFVKNAAGVRWQRVEPDLAATDPAAELADGEELLPLFPINFQDTGQPRRLLTGMIPVGRREEYMGARAHHEPPATKENGSVGGGGATPSGTTAKTARKEQFRLEVSEPWKNLVRFAHATAARIHEPFDGEVENLLGKWNTQARRANEQLQVQSWLVLLDFADFLALHLPRVWDSVLHPATATTLNTPEGKLFDWLDRARMTPESGWQLTRHEFTASLREALVQVRSARSILESAVGTFIDEADDDTAWPNFLYLLAGVRQDGNLFDPTFSASGPFTSLGPLLDVTADVDDLDATASPHGVAEADAALLDKLVQLVMVAMDEAPAAPAPPLPFAAQLREAIASSNGDPGWFVLRCAYVRWECGPLHRPLLSPPSQRFQLASFFDPDAPARPIRIALPLDTTPAGMRKFNKNTAFIISDVLCGQLQRAKGLGLGDLVLSVLPWPFHKDLDVGGGGLGPCTRNGASLGMICSLSIPIITICALILLMMIVLVLDMIFRWIPWFIICFPIPGLKAKR